MSTILIVDDDPTILELLEVNLEMEGYEVVRAEDGRMAIEKAGTERPDLILMDVMMPGMDGLTARQELSKIPELAHIPVVFLSAAAQRTDVRKGLELGATDYITKPFEPEELLSLIERILGGTYERPQDRESR